MKKISKNLGENQRLAISTQARNFLALHDVDENKFIENVTKLFDECFKRLNLPFHRVLVSKATDGFGSLGIKIVISDAWIRLEV